MGVRGLKSFLEYGKQTRPIDIRDEVLKWKSANPGQTPIIIIDFLSLTNCVAKKQEDTICGGRHQFVLESWKTILDLFKSTEAELVFFSDLTVQTEKNEEWLNRRDEEFKIFKKLYDLIDSGISLEKIVAEQKDAKSLSSTFYGMAIIARKYGTFHSSVRHECDLEAAQYATRHNALAVITNDTDFLIFEGSWRFWSSQDINITQSNRLKTAEYNRNALLDLCSLSMHQLPLLATLVTNDHTHSYYDRLARFFYRPTKNRIRNVAIYVRKIGSIILTDDDITRIIRQIFGYTDDELQQVFRKSLNSYKIDFTPVEIDDPLEKKLLGTNMYSPYVSNKSHNQGLNMGFYDMQGSEPNSNLSMLMCDWIKRKKGIMRNQSRDLFNFSVLMKKSIDENFRAHTETPIYPDFQVPPLDQLYIDSGANTDDSTIIEIKWKLFTWIMSFSDDVVSAIKQLPKDFLLIGTVVFVLVKEGFIGIDEADGLLYSEHSVYAKQTMNAQYPVTLVSKYVRAAHIYNITFSHIRQNFAIAGLLSLVNDVLQFDGVYFQELMGSLTTTSTTEREILFAPIKKYRIYA